MIRSLDPALAPSLPGLSGLVAETGSALSHLAVLAREYRVPTAVGVPGAVDRFPAGTPLSVDGGTGAVTAADTDDDTTDTAPRAITDTAAGATTTRNTRRQAALERSHHLGKIVLEVGRLTRPSRRDGEPTVKGALFAQPAGSSRR